MSEGKLTFEELELLFKRLLLFMKKWGIKDVSFDDKDDYYFKVWHQDREFTNEFLDKPKYTLGSLAEDITDLKRLLDMEEMPGSLDVEKLGATPTALGAIMLEKLTYPKSKAS